MEGAIIGNVVARTLLIISAAVVIGLSVNQHEIFTDAKEYCDNFVTGRLAREACDFGRIIPSLAYGIAAGAFGLLDGLVGLVAAFVSAVPWVVMAVLDGLTAIILLAHGIVSALYANSRPLTKVLTLATELCCSAG